MEAHAQVAVTDPANDRLNEFYVLNRDRWVNALRNFVEKPEMVSESGEALSERGVQVGALALPEAAPTNVVLNVPYLTGKDGFSEQKAIALAIHEAGHFAVPGISEAEHKFLDQVAVLLTWKRNATKTTLKEMRVKNKSSHGSLALTSDGLKLVQFPGDYSISVTHLETGWEEILKPKCHLNSHPCIGYLGEDWVKVALDDKTYSVRNLLTNQTVTIDVGKHLDNGGLMANLRVETWVKDSKLYVSSTGGISVYDLNTGENQVVPLPNHDGRPGGPENLSASMKTLARLEDNAYSFVDIRTGKILDFVRVSAWFVRTIFLDENRVLISNPYGVDRAEDKIVDIATGKAVPVDSGAYVGRTESTLYFGPNNDKGVGSEMTALNVKTLARTAIAFGDGAVYRVGLQGDGDKFLVSDEAGKVWLFDAGTSQLQPVNATDQSETPVFIKTTASGRVAVTRTEGSGREGSKVVVRWLD